MSSVTHGLFKMFRGGTATEAAAPAAAERVSRRSSGLGEFTRAIAGEQGLRVLDLGPTSPTNLTHFSEMGHRIYTEDVLLAAHDSSLAVRGEDGKIGYNVPHFLTDNLAYEREFFDAVLCWDLADYLPEPLVKPMVERLHYVTKPGAVLLGFFHTRDAGPEAPYFRYHVTGKDMLELQRGPKFRLQRVFANRHIENLFHDFGSLKFFLARDNVREVLVVR